MKTSGRLQFAALSLAGSFAMTLAGCFSDAASNSGSGGSPGTGSGGDASSEGSAAPSNVDLIDDMEDNDGSILSAGGRVGAWYTYNDLTTGAMQTPTQGATFTMTPGGAGGSAYAANTHGSGFTTWGAGLGLNLKDPGSGDGGSAKATYDASAYSGITFWAKVGAGSVTSVRVNVSNKDTDLDGHVCMPAKCSDHFGKDQKLTTEWAQYVIPFDKMTPVGWAMQSLAKFDLTTLYAIQFQVGMGTTFDIWIDDIGFIQK